MCNVHNAFVIFMIWGARLEIRSQQGFRIPHCLDQYMPPIFYIGTTVVWTTDHCDRTYSIIIGSYKNIELYKNDVYPWVYTIYTQVLNLLTFL